MHTLVQLLVFLFILDELFPKSDDASTSSVPPVVSVANNNAVPISSGNI